MTSFFRRFSLGSHAHRHSHSHSAPSAIPLTQSQQSPSSDSDKVEDLNPSFTHRDADRFCPLLVREMTWTRFQERVLDLGCGSGRSGFTHLLPEIYQHDGHLYGVDASEALITFASMKYPHPYITYIHGDLLSPSFPLKHITFDKIFALHVLQCMPDQGLALSTLFNLLRPGGELGLTFATNFYIDELNSFFSKEERWASFFPQEKVTGESGLGAGESENNEEKENDSKFRFKSAQSFQRKLIDAGFEVVKVEKVESEYEFPSVEKAVVYYMQTSPYVHSIPAEMQDPFEQDCLTKLVTSASLIGPAAPFLIKYDCIVAVARKPGFPSKKPKHGGGHKLRQRLSLP